MIPTAYRKTPTNGNIVNGGPFSMPKSGAVAYVYAVNTGTGKLICNRLYHVSDLQANASAFADDIDDEGSFTPPNQNGVSNVNYAYTEIGELQKDKAEHIDSMRWNVYGKVERIYFNNGKPSVQFLYDASGNRIAKLLKNINASSVIDSTYASTYYWRDAQGNTLATESRKFFSVGSNVSSVTHATEVEYSLFGSGRIGVYQDTIPYDITTYTPYGKYKRYGARRIYELSNHRQDVMATVSDVKTFSGVGYKSKVLSAQFYYPFGMQMPARSYNAPSYGSLFKYKYGIQGAEEIDEIKGPHKVVDLGNRMEDVRLGRMFTTDRKEKNYPWQSTYAYYGNSPIRIIDYNGDGAKTKVNHKNKSVTVRANIYMYSDNKDINIDCEVGCAKQNIMNNYKSGTFTTSDDQGEKYKTNFEFNVVNLGSSANAQTKFNELTNNGASPLSPEDNFILLNNNGDNSSWSYGNMGTWAVNSTNNNLYAHEILHLLGFKAFDNLSAIQQFTDHVNPKDPNPSLSNGNRNSKLSQYDINHLNFGKGLMKSTDASVLKNLPNFNGALKQNFGDAGKDHRMIGRETGGTTIFHSFQDASQFYDAFTSDPNYKNK